MEPSLVVIGINHRTAPLAVRERFWMSEGRRGEVLLQLLGAEGMDEVLVLSTCNRTEFVLWANDPSLAANSILNFLTREYGLKLCEWVNFYRLLDEAALQHIFRVASGLDSMILGEPHIVQHVQEAWELAQQTRTTGRHLDAIMQKALAVSKRVRTETAVGSCAVSVPYAAVELARQIFGTLEQRKVLLLGAGRMSELSAGYLVQHGVSPVCVMSRTLEHAQELAAKLGGTAAPLAERSRYLAEVDIVISSSASPHVLLTKAEAEVICEGRGDAPLLIVDMAVPRDMDPAVRDIRGVFLYDVDDLEQAVHGNAEERKAAAAEAAKIVVAEAREFLRRLQSERVVPTIVALRSRLDELCRQELDSFRRDSGPFTQDYDKMLEALTSRITQRIAGSLARELKDLPEKTEQERVAAVVQRLFQLERPKAEAAVAARGR